MYVPANTNQELMEYVEEVSLLWGQSLLPVIECTQRYDFALIHYWRNWSLNLVIFNLWFWMMLRTVGIRCLRAVSSCWKHQIRSMRLEENSLAWNDFVLRCFDECLWRQIYESNVKEKNTHILNPLQNAGLYSMSDFIQQAKCFAIKLELTHWC